MCGTSGRNGPNRLISCSSPYLRQHADNPVDWYPWGEDAFERARREDKPILLSIGYSACHWCHVMERESFEDPQIAALMNENFVCVKVDREERPDLDRIYMRGVQVLTGSGGWPLTVFLTPELEPFYGGTYFPPEDQPGTRSFPQVLRAVREAYDDRPEDISTAAEQIMAGIQRSLDLVAVEGELGYEMVESALRAAAGQFDLGQAGFGTQAKFPQAPLLDWLLRLWADSGDERARLIVESTMDHMADGGIFDHVGGGFHRYTVDSAWRVPHFEKMLYDNAQLIGLYADAARAWGRHDYLQAARRTADYVLRELCHPDGGFCASQDADSQGEEGRYYAWTRDELMDCLGPELGRLAAEHFGVTPEGNWEDGLNVLYRAVPVEELPVEDPEEARRMLKRAREILLERRRERVPPDRDDKVLMDWNSLMITGLARLHRAANGDRYLTAARGAAEFLWRELWRGGRPVHNWRDGRSGQPAYLADVALFAAALLDLYECTFEPELLRRARRVARRITRDHWDEDAGRFHEAPDRAEALIAQPDTFEDEPTPSGASAAVHVLQRLSALGDADGQAGLAERVLRSAAGLMEQNPTAVPNMLSALLRHVREPTELVIVEPPNGSLR
ncbi:MAG: thioredoxin domain-containing protein, partial [Candidatus Brocadiia bacterium]